MRPFAFAFALLAALPAAAIETSPTPWWVLRTVPLHAEKEGPAVVFRSAREADSVMRWIERDKMTRAAVVDRVDFEKWMLVLVRCEGNCGAKWDVKGASWDCKAPTLLVVREMNPDGNEMAAISSLLVLVPRTEKDVVVTWSDGDVAKMQKDRDCGCKGGAPPVRTAGDKDAMVLCGLCKKVSVCGGPTWCDECANARQACATCHGRIAGDPEFKKAEEKK
ncbi:MAG: hypothetical protein AAB074_23110 [Planctomycetota bacterium]